MNINYNTTFAGESLDTSLIASPIWQIVSLIWQRTPPNWLPFCARWRNWNWF